MSYTVLARKYRPQTFADQVGQEHVTRTLANAINSGRIAHAFLFTGVRGVGKTTSARLLAKALNCEKGPTPEPCNVCDACKQITAGVDLDVLEIDGASNNGVDDVRRLQESLPYRPTRDRFKIVIVDEVHMLTSGAFNAFLKTLEEPPAHVKFIFATTEAHKIPITIRSRCQHYSFRLIPQNVIADRVRHILAAEGIEADAQAVAIVAREAAGSMRDALTLLDQVIAFSGDKLFGNEVAQKLGLADRDHLFRVAEAVLSGDAKQALEVIDAISSQGLDFTHFTRQWLELMRDMVVLRVAGERNELIELPEVERARAAGIATAHELLELERVFSGIAKLIDELGKAGAPRVVLEMGVVRLATRPPLRDLSELIARLSQLENSSGSSAGASGGAPAAPRQPPPASRPPSSGGFVDPAARSSGDRGGQDAAPRGAPDVGSRGPMPGKDPAGAKPNPFQRFIPPESKGHGGPGGGGPSMGGSAQAGSPNHGGPTAGPTMAAVTPIGHARSAAAQAVVHAPVEELRVPSSTPVASQLVVASPTNTQTEPPRLQAAPAPRPAAPTHPLPELWLTIIAELRKGDLRWAAMFEHGVPSQLNREQVVVTFQEGSFFGRQAQTQGGLDALQRAVQAAMQASPKLDVRFAAELQGVSVAKREAAQLDERKEGIKRKALGHPRVLEALKVFPELATKQDVQVD